MIDTYNFAVVCSERNMAMIVCHNEHGLNTEAIIAAAKEILDSFVKPNELTDDQMIAQIGDNIKNKCGCSVITVRADATLTIDFEED